MALTTFAAPVVVGHGYLPGMYIIGALPFLTLAVGAGLETMWERLEKHTATLTAKGRLRARRAGMACLVVGLLPVFWMQWIDQGRSLLTQQANTDWASTLEWDQGNVLEEDTILVEFHMAGNQVQVEKQEVQNAAHTVGKSRLGTGAVGDSQEEPDEGPEEAVAAAGIEEEDPGQVPAVACSVP